MRQIARMYQAEGEEPPDPTTHKSAPEGSEAHWLAAAEAAGELVHFARNIVTVLARNATVPYALCDAEEGLLPDVGKWVMTGKWHEVDQYVTCPHCRRMALEHDINRMLVAQLRELCTCGHRRDTHVLPSGAPSECGDTLCGCDTFQLA